jgi:hypothetical protein
VLVCSPQLLRVACTRASQIPLANALCVFVACTSVIDAAAPSRVDASAHAQVAVP